MASQINWNYSKPLRSTWLLDQVLDREKGWPFSEQEIAITLIVAEDGNPNYLLKIDNIETRAYEIQLWQPGVASSVTPGKMVVLCDFSGVQINNLMAFTGDNYIYNGSPAYGTQPNGQPSLLASFPISPDFPVHLARAQFMWCLGRVFEESESCLQAWNSRPANSVGSEKVNWEGVRNVAGVVGALARGFAGI